MNILIAAPVRNRAWVLPEYLEHLRNLDYPKEKLAFKFILNDSTDESEKILNEFKENYQPEYRYIEIEKADFGYPSDWGEDREKNKLNRFKYAYKALSKLRNLILATAWADLETDYLFQVDSDILVRPDVLKRLIECGKDIVAALVVNKRNKLEQVFAYNFTPLSDSRIIVPDGLFEVKTTGAVVLISRKVFENISICYSPKDSGEDEGFCENARKQGFKSYILPVLQEHIMERREKVC